MSFIKCRFSAGRAFALATGLIFVSAPTLGEECRVVQKGKISWYGGKRFHGQTMAYGGTFDRYGDSVASLSLPKNTRVKIELEGRNAPVADAVVRDKGPYVGRRVMDVSEGLAERMGFKEKGTVNARILRCVN